jgi:cytoskeletal protein CcmA (bactofilin family)
MDETDRRALRNVVLAVVVIVATAGVAAAQSTRAGGSVVVAEGETVGDLRAAGGTVVVRGTVDGDLRGYAGTVVVEETGVVTSDLQASAGSINVLGTVEGDVEGAAGSVSVGPEAVVGEDLTVAAADLVVAGTVEGSVKAAVQRLNLAETASVAGGVQYSSDAEFVRADGATVGGPVSAVDNLSVDAGLGDIAQSAGPLGFVFGVYGVLVTLLFGAVLLVAFPEFTDAVAAEVHGEPLRSGGVGLGGLIGIPLVLVLVAVTVVGLPLSILGFMALGLVVFAAAALAEYTVGAWALSYTDVDSRWIALVAGVLGVAILSRIPLVGRLVDFVVFLLGFGAVLTLLYRRYRRYRGDRSGGRGVGASS